MPQFSARAFRPPQPPLLAFLAGLVLLGACQAQSSLILSYIDFDTFASVKVSDSFMGISSNYETLPTYVGNTTFQQLMKNALAFGNKGSIVFRAMGIPKSIPTSTWQTLGEAAQNFPAKYLLQLPLKMTNRPKSEWDASKYKGIDMLEAANRWIGSDKILGFPLGNEPDWFVHNRGWDKEWYFRVNGDYDRDVSRVEEAVRPLLNSMFGTCRMLVASETANFWTSLKTTDRLQQLLKDHRCLRTISTHHYSGSAKSSGYTYDNLLSNEILYGAMATAQEMVGVAIKEQADYRVTETGSLYGGGRWGMSDRFGAALWMLEVSMGLAFRGTAGVNFNGVGCSPNALVMVGDCSEQLHFDKLGPGFRPNPTYYGMLMFQRALGSGARISQLVTNNGGLNMGTWGFNPTDADSWDKRRVVVINRERWKSGRVSITLTGSYRPAATVCQLTASTTKTPRENATAGRVTICGQQVNAQGELTPTNPKFDWVDGVESWSSEINKQMTTFTFWMESVTAVVLEATLKW